MFVEDGHPVFTDEPDPGSWVWRYMDLARYLSLVQASALHFVRLDHMADRWEGAFGSANSALRPEIYGDNYATLEPQFPALRATIRTTTLVNCWHEASVESAAMWSLYQREGRGVAVVSTWADLKSSITGEADVRGARVRYVDYAATYIPENNLMAPPMYKRESFAHEREVRLMHTWDRTITSAAGQNVATEAPPVVPVAVDLSKLVSEVRVAPDAPTWIFDVVESVTRRYGFSFPVRQSDLATDPID